MYSSAVFAVCHTNLNSDLPRQKPEFGPQPSELGSGLVDVLRVLEMVK